MTATAAADSGRRTRHPLPTARAKQWRMTSSVK
jgi:hypothetical protein